MPDTSESLGRPLAGSVIFHSAAVGLIALSGFLHLKSDTWGEQHASSGSVGVEMVPTIPIPRNKGPVNPLANDSTSEVPEAPAEKPVKAVMKAPDPRAIELPDKVDKRKKTAPKEVATNVFHPMHFDTNQVLSHTPQAANSPMYGLKGSGGIDVGPATVFGDRFGPYANIMRNLILQKWNRADVHPPPSAKCAVIFTIARNGGVSNVQITHPSGDYLLDASAKRAILDANPLPPLPAGFERSEATVELWFQLDK